MKDGCTVLKVWRGIFIRNRYRVQPAIVAANAPRAVFFYSEVYRAGPGAARRTANASLDKSLELGFGGPKLIRSQASRTFRDWRAGGGNVMPNITIRGRI